MNDLELFKLLYATLGTYQEASFDYAAKATAFLLLAMGWVLTSGQAGTLLQSHHTIKALAATLIALCSVLYCVLNWRLRSQSERVAEQIAQLKQFDRAVYDHRVFGTVAAVMLCVGNAGISIVAIALVIFAA